MPEPEYFLSESIPSTFCSWLSSHRWLSIYFFSSFMTVLSLIFLVSIFLEMFFSLHFKSNLEISYHRVMPWLIFCFKISFNWVQRISISAMDKNEVNSIALHLLMCMIFGKVQVYNFILGNLNQVISHYHIFDWQNSIGLSPFSFMHSNSLLRRPFRFLRDFF